jgi:SWI/SNF-related matrix-associated actin-dependent regulator 1 of chromatin subfamily A
VIFAAFLQGLGKTVQTIVFLRYLKHLSDQNSAMSPRLPHLVVVPASVLSNWERELQTFAPDLSVVKFHGTMQEREDLRDEITARLRAQDQIAGRSQEIDVILAPVSYFQKEKATERQFLKRFEYDYLVVDEAHVLKNANGTRFKSLNRLRSQHRLLLTGTPVQVNSRNDSRLAFHLRLLTSHYRSFSSFYSELSPGAFDAPVLPDAQLLDPGHR